MTDAEKAKADVDVEVQRVLNWMHSVLPDRARTRVTTLVARGLLLSADPIIRGNLYSIRSESLGAGVYEVYLEARVWKGTP